MKKAQSNGNLSGDLPWEVDEFFDLARIMLNYEEGYRDFPYDDASGKPVSAVGFITIGIGRNLKANPLSFDEVQYLFRNDFERALAGARGIFSNYDSFSLPRRLAILSMVFQMGIKGLYGFRNTLKLIEAGKWKEAGESAAQSKWARVDSPARARRVIRMLVEDIFVYENP